MKWRTKDGEATEDANGYPIPGTPGVAKETPCRYHTSGSDRKQFILDDGTTVIQKGQIRLDAGVELPKVGQRIIIEGVLDGIVLDTYVGQLSSRIDV